MINIQNKNGLRPTPVPGAFLSPWILPRAKKCPPDTFCTSVRTGAALSNPISSSANNKGHPEGWPLLLAEDEGFEPPQTESESGVLPLHKSSIFPRGTLLLYPIFRKCQGHFLEFPGFFSDCQVSANRKKMHRMISGLNGQILRLSGGHFLFVFVEFAECPWYIVKYRMDKNAYRLSAVNK